MELRPVPEDDGPGGLCLLYKQPFASHWGRNFFIQFLSAQRLLLDYLPRVHPVKVFQKV